MQDTVPGGSDLGTSWALAFKPALSIALRSVKNLHMHQQGGASTVATVMQQSQVPTDVMQVPSQALNSCERLQPLLCWNACLLH